MLVMAGRSALLLRDGWSAARKGAAKQGRIEVFIVRLCENLEGKTLLSRAPLIVPKLGQGERARRKEMKEERKVKGVQGITLLIVKPFRYLNVSRVVCGVAAIVSPDI